jgi:ABC-2 type transport system ATP-binding protein
MEIRLVAPAAEAAGLGAVPGVRNLTLDGDVIRLAVEGSMDPLVKELAKLPVRTLTSEPPELDEIFRSYYGAPDAD